MERELWLQLDCTGDFGEWERADLDTLAFLLLPIDDQCEVFKPEVIAKQDALKKLLESLELGHAHFVRKKRIIRVLA